MKRSKSILLLIAYAALFVFTLSMEWIGIREPRLRAVVNISTLALVLFGGAFCFFLYRRMSKGAGENDGKKTADTAEEAGQGETEKNACGRGKENVNGHRQETAADSEKECMCIVGKSAYLVFAHEKELTRREAEIGFLAVNGYSNQRIAQELYISEATVKKHLTHIYEKTGANGRKELKAAAGAGIKEPPH